jgi:2',3'-cyclic-nucleotide 2'-phosphodiesterase (5'-nucleotidase family)
MTQRLTCWALAVAVAACSGKTSNPPSTQGATAPTDSKPVVHGQQPPAVPRTGTMTLSIVGTNDLHGHVLGDEGKGRLDVFGGYLANLRKARAADGGAVVVVDGGDAFQGTLESNLNEGEAVTAAYGALGYAAMAIGNHEFDFGPAGEPATPQGPNDDPRGALKARAAQAGFPFLAANVIDSATGKPVEWPNVKPSTIVDAAGVKVGIIGITTIDTPRVTMAANFAGLEMAPLADTVAAEAKRLREAGCAVVVVTAHAGGRCGSFKDPEDTTSCHAEAEIFAVARALPAGAVDVIVGGHSHAGVAHMVAGVPIIESFKYGVAFGRVDLTVDRATGKVSERRIHAPRDIVFPGDYEGAPVVADPAVAQALDKFLAASRARSEEKLGVTLSGVIKQTFDAESAEGNLIVDLMRKARPADVAITNGGGLRAPLPAGELTYGQFFEAQPFDNRFAALDLTGKDLREVVRRNLQATDGIFSFSGVRITARCEAQKLVVELTREDGKAVKDGDTLTITTSDFLATGGLLGKGPAKVEDGPPIREALVDILRKDKGTIDPPAYFDPARPRVAYPGKRPVQCK